MVNPTIPPISPKNPPEGHTYNPDTGVYVSNANITQTSITTPSYSYFQSQPIGRSVLGLNTQPGTEVIRAPVEVRPNKQGSTISPTYTQKQVESYYGPGMVAASKELSPLTIQFLVSQGYAPSDTSPKALSEFISIGKQYQSKQPSFQLPNSFGPSKPVLKFGSGESSGGVSIDTSKFQSGRSRNESAIAFAREYLTTPPPKGETFISSQGPTQDNLGYDLLMRTPEPARSIYAELSKVSQEGFGLGKGVKSAVLSPFPEGWKKTVGGIPVLGNVAKGFFDIPESIEGFFIKAPAALIPALYVGLEEPKLAQGIAQQTVNQNIEAMKTAEYWEMTAGTLGGMFLGAKMIKASPLVYDKAGFATPEGGKTVWQGLAYKPGEGAAKPIIGITETWKLGLGTPKAGDMPSLFTRELPEHLPEARNAGTNIDTGINRAILGNTEALKAQGLGAGDIRKVELTGLMLDRIKVPANQNPFVGKELPEATKYLNKEQFTAVKKDLIANRAQIDRGYGSLPEQSQKPPELQRTAGDFEVIFKTEAAAQARSMGATTAINEITLGMASVSERGFGVNVKTTEGGIKLALDYKYEGQPPEDTAGFEGKPFAYGYSQMRKTITIEKLPVSTLEEQYIRKAGASTIFFKDASGRTIVEPGSPLPKSAGDFYAESKAMVKIRTVKKMNTPKELSDMTNMVKEWRGLDWKTEGVQEKFAEVDLNEKAYFEGQKIDYSGLFKGEKPSSGIPRGSPVIAGSMSRTPIIPSRAVSITLSKSRFPSISELERSFASQSFPSPSKVSSVSRLPSPRPSKSPSFSRSFSPSPLPSGSSFTSKSPSVSLSPSRSLGPSPSPSPSISPRSFLPSSFISPSVSPSESKKYFGETPFKFSSQLGSLDNFKRKKGIKFPKFKEKRGRSILQPHLTYIEKTRLELRKQEPYRITVPSTPKTRAAYIKAGLGAFGRSGLLKAFGKKRKKKRGKR